MSNELYQSRPFTTKNGFTSGIEGPASDAEGYIYAVNYERQHTIGRVNSKGEGSVFLELPDGSTGSGIQFNRKGDMFIADHTNHNILKVDIKTRELSVHAHEPKMNQPNDLTVHTNGVIFASDPNWKEKTGQIWRVDLNGETTLLEADMGTTNGIEVSPDGRILYVNETVQRKIWAYDISTSNGISNKRLLIEFPDFGLDGMRCDQDGNLYVTRYGKGTVVQLSPQGEVIREIQLHGKKCTNLTFGGADGRDVYVTIADQGNIETFRVETPGNLWYFTHGK